MPERPDPLPPLPAPAPPGDRREGGGPGRIVVVSASVGAGHDGAAAGLAERLRAHGYLVDRRDFLDLLPAGAGRLLCGGYHRLLTWAPEGYQHLYRTTDRSRPGRVWRALFRSAGRRLLRDLPPDTRAVVSTYPGASQVLGALRRRGALAVPALTYLTDFSVHALWVAAGIDAHLAVHAVPAAQAHAQGAAAVTVAGPVADPRFTPAAAGQRSGARARFGLPERGPLALMVAGSWGVGPVRQAAAEIRATGLAVPVVVCGRNDALAARLRQDGVEHAFGWVDDMPGLMHACDVLVQNAGGLTSLEAFAAGLPVASYRCIPGHGRTNARALEEAGLAAWIRGADDLAPVLAQLLHGQRGEAQRAAGIALHRSAPGPVPAIAARAGDRPAAPAPGRRPSPARRPERRRGRLRLGAAALAAAAALSLGVAAPVAHAYHHDPARFTVAHYLHGDRS
ncbi:UDP-N-acetylglucosamine:LPS N-acetylglucosamine transferase [Actinacidiphila yanglinensis]|uniref:UDP-N-acetylglucosamine:LPS N-acetylglucosamine transferase n=1 Tax=Actinacidiphila yanglinensis TaxID=310779 RepID=A0A1H6DZD9_9ACTN|nr:glycosyltransferase [Actinacidiphila yanglinensis]SEG90692.1 UDP-N-acetylglucosamine:LPS N-acetylglucosamine transferase [Actinacidiphila yanglinensis]